MIPELHTERLILRPVQMADAEQVQQIFPQWEIVKYLNAKVPWPFPDDGVRAYYRDQSFPAIERGDEWHWTIRLKSAPDRIIGSLSLHRSDRINRGFWLAPPYHGQGLMTEAVAVTNDYWFDVLRFPVLRAPKAVLNTASRRISEKTGMRVISVYEGEYVSGTLMTEKWELTAEDWRRHRNPPPA